MWRYRYYYDDDDDDDAEALVNGASPPEAEEDANLHLYLRAVDLLSHGFNDANHNVLQAFSLRVVVKNEAVPLLRVRAAEGWRPHPRVDGAQVVMQSVKILKSPINSHKTHKSQINSILHINPSFLKLLILIMVFFTCKNSRTFDPKTRKMVSYPDS